MHRISAQNDAVGSIAVLVTELSYLVLWSLFVTFQIFSAYNFKTSFVMLSAFMPFGAS